MTTGTGTRIRPKKLNQYVGMGMGVIVLGLLGPILFGQFGHFSPQIGAALGAFLGAIIGWLIAGLLPAHEATQKPPHGD